MVNGIWHKHGKQSAGCSRIAAAAPQPGCHRNMLAQRDAHAEIHPGFGEKQGRRPPDQIFRTNRHRPVRTDQLYAPIGFVHLLHVVQTFQNGYREYDLGLLPVLALKIFISVCLFFKS